MSNLRTVKKSLIGQEDILYGEGTVVQSRAQGNYNINKVRSIYPVNSLAELNDLDTDKFTKARLYNADGTYVDYEYYSGAWNIVVNSASTELTLSGYLAADYLVPGELRRSTGYATDGDGGANTYRIWPVGTAPAYDGGKWIYNPVSNVDMEGLFPDGIVNVKQFGAAGDGTNNDTVAIAAAISYASGRVYFSEGTYSGSNITYAGDVLAELAAGAILLFEFLRPTISGNLFSIDNRSPSLGQLGSQNNPALPQNNSLCVTRGDKNDPDNTTKYSETAIYTELHTSASVSDPQSVWGSSWKIGAVMAEAQAHSGAEVELNGGAFRSYSTDEPVSLTKRNLVGVSAIGQTNTGASNDSWGVFGANFVAAETSGNNAPNCVGIEVDLVHENSADFTIAPSEGNNYTGYWAQSDANGVYSHTAFYASQTARSDGWANILRFQGDCYGPMVVLRNNRNDANARGIIVEMFYGGAAGRLIDLAVDNGTSRITDTAFRVTGEDINPVYIKVNGSLEQVEVGAPDTGGTGFRLLRVAN